MRTVHGAISMTKIEFGMNLLKLLPCFILTLDLREARANEYKDNLCNPEKSWLRHASWTRIKIELYLFVLVLIARRCFIDLARDQRLS